MDAASLSKSFDTRTSLTWTTIIREPKIMRQGLKKSQGQPASFHASDTCDYLSSSAYLNSFFAWAAVSSATVCAKVLDAK